jgi:hypothetical protein
MLKLEPIHLDCDPYEIEKTKTPDQLDYVNQLWDGHTQRCMKLLKKCNSLHNENILLTGLSIGVSVVTIAFMGLWLLDIRSREKETSTNQNNKEESVN